MQKFKIIDVTQTPYLFVDRITSMDGAEIGKAMHTGLAEVWAFMEHHGVPPAGSGLSVYYDYEEGRMPFRVGFVVKPDDMEAAQGAVKADMTPGGKAVHFTHSGSYAGLRPAYEEMMSYLEAEGLQYAAPTWELYLNDPNEVHEEQLVTECYQAFVG